MSSPYRQCLGSWSNRIRLLEGGLILMDLISEIEKEQGIHSTSLTLKVSEGITSIGQVRQTGRGDLDLLERIGQDAEQLQSLAVEHGRLGKRNRIGFVDGNTVTCKAGLVLDRHAQIEHDNGAAQSEIRVVATVGRGVDEKASSKHGDGNVGAVRYLARLLLLRTVQNIAGIS